MARAAVRGNALTLLGLSSAAEYKRCSRAVSLPESFLDDALGGILPPSFFAVVNGEEGKGK